MAKRKLDLRLSFQVTECERCKGEREFTQPCFDCGQRPKRHETQPDLDRRRVLYRRLQDSRSEKTPAAFPVDPLDTLQQVTDRVLASLAEASRSGYDAKPLIVAFSDLDQVVADTGTQRLRPHLNDGRRVHRLAVAWRAALNQFAGCLVASNRAEAQEFQDEANSMLNRALEEFAPSSRDSVGEALIDADAPVMALLGAYHRSASGEASLREWPQRLGPALGLPGNQPDLHVLADSLELLAVGLDRERFYKLAGLAEEHLAVNASVLERVDVRADMANAQLLVDGAYASLLAAVQNHEDDWHVVQLALALALVLRERALQRLVAVLLCRDDPDAYAERRSEKIGPLLASSEAAFPRFGFHELHSPLRHASAHQDFEVDGDHVLLDRGKTRLTADELTDLVLQSVEAYNGVLLGVVGVLLTHGLSLPAATPTPRHRRAAVEYVLAWQGVTSVRLEERAEAIDISARGDRLDWLGTVAVLSPLFERTVPALTMTLQTEGGERRLTADLAPFHEWQDSVGQERTEAESHLAFLRTAAAVLVDGQATVEPRLWVAAALFYADPARNPRSTPARRQDVEQVRDLAIKSGVGKEEFDDVMALLEESEIPRDTPTVIPFGRRIAFAPIVHAPNRCIAASHRWWSNS